MSVMTTKDNFPVVNITHKPKRMQGDNLRVMQSESPVEFIVESTDVPQTATLERAISFYESHAEGEYRTLYLQTAKWLREYMSKTVPVNVPVPDGTDIDKAQELLAQARRGN